MGEISLNHQNKLNKVLKLISKAKEAGADAIKIQTYDENAMTINSSNKEFIIKGGIWHNYKLYDLYSKAKTPFEWHENIQIFCKNWYHML